MKRRRANTWDIRIASYLFLAGVGAGAFGSLALLDYLEGGKLHLPTSITALLSLLLIGIGTLLLVSDLGKPLRFWRVLLNPMSSMLSVGAWILILFALTMLGYLGFGGPVFSLGGVVFAIATAGYTGILLGVMKARPFWNSPALPLLFVTSAFSTGIAVVTVLASALVIYGLDAQSSHLLSQVDLCLIVAELAIIGLYLTIMNNSAAPAARSVEMLLRGKQANTFWGGLIFAGLVVPLVLALASSEGVTNLLSSILVLIGGFSLRYTFLAAGTRALLPGEPAEASYL